MENIKTTVGFEFRNLDGNSTIHIAIVGGTRSLCGVAKFKDDAPFNRSHIVYKHKLCLKCMGRRDAYEEHVEVEGEKDQRIEELEADKDSLIAIAKSAEEEFAATTSENEKYLHQIVELKKTAHNACANEDALKTKVEELEALNAAPDPLVGELKVKLEQYEIATWRHSLENVNKVMKAMPPARTIENMVLEHNADSYNIDLSGGEVDMHFVVKLKHKSPEVLFLMAVNGGGVTKSNCRGWDILRLIPHAKNVIANEWLDVMACRSKVDGGEWICFGHWNDGLECEVDENE